MDLLPASNPSPLVCPSAMLQPGFDPLHPAASAFMFCSAVAAVAPSSGVGIFRPLYKAVGASTVGNPQPRVDGIIGQTVGVPGASATWGANVACLIPNNSGGITKISATFAAIIKPGAPVGSLTEYYCDSSNFPSVFILRGNSGVGNDLRCGSGGSFAAASGIPLLQGVPYFIACSMNSPQQIANFVVTNLATGQIQMAINVASGGNFAGTGIDGAANLTIGNANAQNRPNTGSIAAVMYSGAFLGPSALRQWAQDPWSFWYPTALLDDLWRPEVSLAPSLIPSEIPLPRGLRSGPLGMMVQPFTAALPLPPSAPSAGGGTLPFMGVG
jgi:hypothetical protein